MRRTFTYFSAALVFFVLMMCLSTPYTIRTVKADPTDPCLKCLGKLQKEYEKCEAKYGGPNIVCDEQFNQGIIECYATVCEQ